jgi:phosphatidylserine/phosphatidylglycerophosphate/cardiolipin synthase-like enzyme
LDVPAKPSATSKTLRLPRSVAPGGLQRLTVLEHPLLLRDAVENAMTRVMIFSPWIAPLVMDGIMLLAIRKLLDRGVQLHIGYGLDEDGKHTQKPIPKGLQDLADNYQNFELRRFGDTHEKVLIKDDEFVALTSFNWLSFRGDPDRKLRRELGVKVTDPLFIESEYAVLEARFRAKPPKRRGAVEQ